MKKSNPKISLDAFCNILKEEFTQRYASLMSETSFLKIITQIRNGTYKITDFQMCDLLCQQLHEVEGYVKRDDIITIHSSNNEMSHHFLISVSIEDRLVVDALTKVLYLSNKSYFQENNIYLALSGIQDDYRKEMHSWENVRSVAVFNIKTLLLQLDRQSIWEKLQECIHVDSEVLKLFALYFELFPKHKEDLYQYEAYLEECSEGKVPFRGLPLIGSLPVALITLFSSLDPCVKKFIGDWPYVRIHYDWIFPIFGDSPTDEEPYYALFDHFIGRKVPVDWCRLYPNSGVRAISSGYMHLDNGKVFFTWGDGP